MFLYIKVHKLWERTSTDNWQVCAMHLKLNILLVGSIGSKIRIIQVQLFKGILFNCQKCCFQNLRLFFNKLAVCRDCFPAKNVKARACVCALIRTQTQHVHMLHISVSFSVSHGCHPSFCQLARNKLASEQQPNLQVCVFGFYKNKKEQKG